MGRSSALASSSAVLAILGALFVSSASETASAQTGGSVTVGGGGAPPPPPPPPPPAPAPAPAAPPAEPPPVDAAEADQTAEWVERDRAVNESNTITGGTGLLHTQHAQSGAPGQFRIGFVGEWFKAGFLCTD